ncbi:response regulator [Thiorhodococcus mannitoliphagus]|uniref:histidine kinase n=1 Tax=Thiorhodococcus mannitoliphagus TaxID=329406 RepID=A0A6P1DWH4_9GAMM|nr:response regulator [Thiorhodococcus mannitoliphagus]NEX21351.1 response regulator [Thiorhodococcus mannitoliphagus]
MHIRTKLALALIAILIVNLIVSLYGFYLLTQAASREAAVREQSSDVLVAALNAQVHFKKQVQEWKNVLLRGQQSELYDDYFQRFESEEGKTRRSIAGLIALLSESPEAKATAERFLRAHQRLGQEYRAALIYYRRHDPSPQLEVDRRVRGIDREPADLIDEVVAAALEHKAATLGRIESRTQRIEQWILVLMMAVTSLAVLFLIWLVDRTIGQPIATVTAVARRISAGDFSAPIDIKGRGEQAEMLGALKAMQESLARFQASLTQSEARSRLLLESTGEGIYGVDREGRCIFCNPAGARMLGYASPAGLIGRNMHATLHHSRPDGTPYPVECCGAYTTYRDGIPARVDDEIFWRADGTHFPVEYFANPIRREAELVGAVVTFSDISARKDAEAALKVAHHALAEERSQLAERVRERTLELDRANAELARSAQAKDEFLAAMSHELRTPLTSILGLSETMGDGLLGPLSKQQDKAVRMIHENGKHLLELINDVLDMSRVASGQMSLRWDQVPVSQLCDASLRLVGPSAKRKALQVSLSLDPEVQLARGDSRRLKQMLVNLLSNAVKFTAEGGAIGLDVKGDLAAGALRFGIWDTGMGIPEDQFDRLFKPFVQLDSRPARQFDGTGLGLALAAGMAELHGGRIEVTSQVGKGSRFEIVLPWSGEAQASERFGAVPAGDAVSHTAGASLERPSVLLVDDNESNLEMFSTYLAMQGCEVWTASDGVKAIELARDRHPEVILMDVQMPEMDGLETTRRLRRDPKLRRTPIIALTALAMPGDREQCLEAGMDDYLSKPLGLKELYGTIHTWISRTRAA